MQQIRVAAAALNQTPLDWENNNKNILEVIRIAEMRNVQILCLPEMCITGYGCEDAYFFASVRNKAMAVLRSIAIKIPKGMFISLGLPIEYCNALYNCSCLLTYNTILGFVPKQNLAGDGVHYEPRWFKGWEPGAIGVRDGIPFGDLVFDINNIYDKSHPIRIGFEICEDAWVADRPGSRLAERGVDVILNPSASHFAFGRHETRHLFIAEGSRAFRATYVYSNLLGNEAGRIIYSGDTIIAADGKIIAEGKRLSFKDVIVTTAVVDINYTRTKQIQNIGHHPNLFENKDSVVVHMFYSESIVAKTSKDNKICQTNPGKNNEFDKVKEIEFSRAVALGLFDYMRKSKSQGFVVSLSGGADSSACCVLIRIMCELGADELGIDKFISKSGIKYDNWYGFNAIMKEILTCVYQGSNNSSEETLHSAKTLAEAIGATFYNINIGEFVDGYTKKTEEMLGRELTWEKDDIALQNIQARVRGPSVWMLANIKNALLLTTSNRSEAAVGYCSIDGDTCGGLAPISGVDKNFLLKWLGYAASFNKEWMHGLAPMLALQPTAELRPSKQNQTDEDDLMPYPILDMIERLAIHQKNGPKDTLELLKSHTKLVGNISEEILKEYVDKFFTLLCRNQWKRERYAPAFHLDDANLDPKTWFRFPILSGGFHD